MVRLCPRDPISPHSPELTPTPIPAVRHEKSPSFLKLTSSAVAIDIYGQAAQTQTSYPIPGPPLFTCGGSSSGPTTTSTTSKSTTTSKSSTTSKPTSTSSTSSKPTTSTSTTTGGTVAHYGQVGCFSSVILNIRLNLPPPVRWNRILGTNHLCGSVHLLRDQPLLLSMRVKVYLLFGIDVSFGFSISMLNFCLEWNGAPGGTTPIYSLLRERKATPQGHPSDSP